MARTFYHDLVCPACQRRETLSPDQLLARLRNAGALRRATAPEADEIAELAQVHAARMTCDDCGHLGLSLQEPLIEEDDEDWGDPKPCERCGALIPAERLELFPNTTLCVKCQQSSERGEDTGAVEYCPRCGNILQLRKSRGDGIARYVMECPSCRR
jgi:DNA-directed RNA polymerase subunit M/transcription elongation factor TFIIS